MNWWSWIRNQFVTWVWAAIIGALVIGMFWMAMAHTDTRDGAAPTSAVGDAMSKAARQRYAHSLSLSRPRQTPRPELLHRFFVVAIRDQELDVHPIPDDTRAAQRHDGRRERGGVAQDAVDRRAERLAELRLVAGARHGDRRHDFDYVRGRRARSSATPRPR